MNQISKYKSVVNSNRNRAAKLGLTEHFTEEQWIELLRQNSYKCMACGASTTEVIITADHVVPLAKGGNNTIDNIQVLCKSCNCKKRAKTIDYRNDSKELIERRSMLSHYIQQKRKSKKKTNPKVETDDSLPSKTKITIFQLVKDLEKARGRNYEQSELAELMDVDPRTVKALMVGASTRFDLAVIDKVLRFFRSEGLDITPGDLFVETDTPTDA